MKNTCVLYKKVIYYCLRSKEEERGTTLREFYGGIFIDKETLLASGIEYPIKLEYYKTRNTKENNKHQEIYGIQIIKTEYKKDVNVEEEKIEYVTENERDINNILEKFKENEVTPVSAQYVIEDMFKYMQKN